MAKFADGYVYLPPTSIRVSKVFYESRNSYSQSKGISTNCEIGGGLVTCRPCTRFIKMTAILVCHPREMRIL